MTTSDPVAPPAPWIARCGAALLAAGVAARACMPEDLRPKAEAVGVALLLLGSGLVLVDAALRRRAPASAWTLAVPLLIVPPALGEAPGAAKAGADLFAAAAAGFALRALASREGAAKGRGLVAALLLLLALFGVAQTSYLRADARAYAAEVGHELTTTAQGRAFLASWRASATFTSPNAFAGAMTLILPACVGLVLATSGRERMKAVAATALAAAGFGCAGSAGAGVALLGAAAFGALAWTPRGSRARLAAICGVAAFVAGVGVVCMAATGEGAVAGKLLTLRERFDYAATGRRMLADALPGGFGFGGVAERAEAYAWAGVAFSRSLHNWWLEGLVEGGFWFVPAAAGLLVALAHGLRPAALDLPRGAERATPRERPRGAVFAVAAGVFVAGMLHNFVAFLPLRAEAPPVVDALLAAAVAALLVRATASLPFDAPAVRRGWTLGYLAFLLHGVVDFDLAIAGVATLFGLCAGLLPTPPPPRTSRRATALTAALGVASLVLPIVLIAAAPGS